MKNLKRLLSLLLVFVLVLGILPTGIFASEPNAEATTYTPGETTAATTPETVPDDTGQVPEETSPATVPEETIPEVTAPEETTTSTEATEETTAPTESSETTAPEEASQEATGPEIAAPEATESEESLEGDPEELFGEYIWPKWALSDIMPLAIYDAVYGTTGTPTHQKSIRFTANYLMGNGTIYYTDAQGNSHPISGSGIDILKIGDDYLYCLQPSVQMGAVTYTASDGSLSTVWKEWLTADQREAITLALMYGYPNVDHGYHGADTDSNDGINNNGWSQQIAATQCIIWEIVAGLRQSTPPYNRTDARLYNALDKSGWDAFVGTYNAISDRLALHGKLPSFTTSSANQAATIELEYNASTKMYEATVTDANNMLAYYDFTLDGVTFTKNGNTLKIAAASADVNGKIVHGASNILLDNSTAVALIWSDGSSNAYSNQTALQLLKRVTTPIPAYFKLKAEPSEGIVKIVKATNTGTNLSGWQFNIYSDTACKTKVAGPLTSGADGTISTSMMPGTYYVKEVQDSNHPGWTFDTSVKTVTVKSGETATVTFTNTLQMSFTLEKSINASSDCIAQLEGNSMYSLAGAKYEVYKDGTLQETLTTDANGKAASAKTYALGTVLTIQETVAPKGFQLDSTKYTLTISSDSSKNVIKVSDVPVFDPAWAITKVDKDTTTPQGNGSFSGAVFKFEYFDEYFPNDIPTGTATRTWYFGTDVNGQARYGSTWLATGYMSDSLYTYANGYALPLGTLKVTEVKNSLGYLVIQQPLYASIRQDGNMVKLTWTTDSLKVLIDMDSGNYGIYEPLASYGSIEVQKLDADFGTAAQGDAANLKTEYAVYNMSSGSVKIGDFDEAAPGEVCFTFWTDDSGYYKSSVIFPSGDYKLVEKTAPTGYTLNSDWSQSFTVTDQEETFSFTDTTTALTNAPIRGGVRIVKQDSLLGSATDETAKLDGITYSIYLESANPVVVGGVTYNKGDLVATMKLEWNAEKNQWIAETAADLLPYATYTVQENPMEDGSGFANSDYFLSDEVFTFSIQENGKVVEADTSGNSMVFNDLPVGRIELVKTNTEKVPLSDVKFLLEWSEDGNAWAPVTYSAQGGAVPGGCTSEALMDGCLVTNAEGILSFEGLDPTLQYRLTELETQDGYVLLSDYVFVGYLERNKDNVFSTSFTVVNGPDYEMPSTGASGFEIVTLAILLCGTALTGISLARKKRKV